MHVHVHVLHCTCTCITFSHHSPREDAIGDQKVSDPLTLSLTKSSNSSTRTDLHVTHWGAHIQFVCSLHRFALFPRLSQKFWPAPLGGEPGSPGREGGAGLPSGGDGHFGMEPGSTGGARLHPKPPGSTPKFVSAPLMWGARLHPGRICRAPLGGRSPTHGRVGATSSRSHVTAARGRAVGRPCGAGSSTVEPGSSSSSTRLARRPAAQTTRCSSSYRLLTLSSRARRPTSGG